MLLGIEKENNGESQKEGAEKNSEFEERINELER